MASHRSAARMWELDGVPDEVVELSVKAGRRIGGAKVHRRAASDDPSTAIIDSIPTTGIRRTLVDLAAAVDSCRAGLALDDALRRGLTSLNVLQEELSMHRTRPGTRALRRLLEARDSRDERAESALESAFLQLIRRHALPAPACQYQVITGDQRVARLDFAYPSIRLAIEVDGYRWHSGLESWKADLRRDNRLKLMGWTVLRFTWDDINARPELVARDIRDALELSSLKQSR